MYENLLIFPDKTSNLCKMIPEQHKIILTNNVTKTHRKPEEGTQQNMTGKKKNSKPLQLEKRMERYAERPAFISLKFHKENVKHNTKCCLINPFKDEMGIVSTIF